MPVVTHCGCCAVPAGGDAGVGVGTGAGGACTAAVTGAAAGIGELVLLPESQPRKKAPATASTAMPASTTPSLELMRLDRCCEFVAKDRRFRFRSDAIADAGRSTDHKAQPIGTKEDWREAAASLQ